MSAPCKVCGHTEKQHEKGFSCACERYIATPPPDCLCPVRADDSEPWHRYDCPYSALEAKP